MDFVNESKVSAGWTMGFERDGHELVVVVIKATFLIPKNREEPQLAAGQEKLIEADVFTGEPGLSAPLHEVDYAHRKPMCDVLLNGSAYAPDGEPALQVTVGVKVATMAKSFTVTGDRRWRGSGDGAHPSDPESFLVLPISYDNAYGGVDANDTAPSDVHTYMTNPVGRGYSYFKRDLDGKVLPNTEERGKPVTDPGAAYTPMAFGSLGRNWVPRVSFAGTYDQAWLDDRAPFWPDDFDYRYFQAAPPEQQIPYPAGGEEVVLRNLTPEGYLQFRLPVQSMPVLFIPANGRAQETQANIDTVLIEPDLGRFCLTWRACYPAARSCFDLRRVVAGKTSQAWYGRQRFGGKPYYENLAELVRARRHARR
jgi:hypothetical protein